MYAPAQWGDGKGSFLRTLSTILEAASGRFRNDSDTQTHRSAVQKYFWGVRAGAHEC